MHIGCVCNCCRAYRMGVGARKGFHEHESRMRFGSGLLRLFNRFFKCMRKFDFEWLNGMQLNQYSKLVLQLHISLCVLSTHNRYRQISSPFAPPAHNIVIVAIVGVSVTICQRIASHRTNAWSCARDNVFCGHMCTVAHRIISGGDREIIMLPPPQ